MTDARPIRHDAVPPPTRRGLNRVESATYIGISPTTFDGLVAQGQMPQPKRVGARKIWDARALDLAFDALPGDGDGEPNEWNSIHAPPD